MVIVIRGTGTITMRIKKFPKHTKLEVQWADISSDANWIDAAGIKDAKPFAVKTLGFYLETKKRVLKVAHSIIEGSSDYTCIPWGCIKAIKELEIKQWPQNVT